VKLLNCLRTVEKQREAMDNEMQQAEELRLQSLETIGETSRRKGSDREETAPKPRRSDDTINYLRKKCMCDNKSWNLIKLNWRRKRQNQRDYIPDD
jgi:hypothetical protein